MRQDDVEELITYLRQVSKTKDNIQIMINCNEHGFHANIISGKFLDLLMLLCKISKTKDRLHIDVDYNAGEFHWKVPVSNMTAGEFMPRQLREHEGVDSQHQNH
jgi:hypothetical protein